MGIMPPGIGVWQPSPRRSAGAGFPLAPAPRSDAWLSTPTGWNASYVRYAPYQRCEGLGPEDQPRNCRLRVSPSRGCKRRLRNVALAQLRQLLT
jgi:hypothetical protein